MVPFCETREEWTGYYETVGTETVPVPFTDYRQEPIPGTGVLRTEEKRVPPYIAYRFKVRWVNKVVTVARTVLKRVTKSVRKVKTWFERTLLGKLVKKVRTWFEPVTEWMRRTVWDRITQRVREVFMEPYPVYNYETVAVWVPLRTREVAFTNYYEVEKPVREKIMEPVEFIGSRWTYVEARGIPVWILREMFGRLPPCQPLAERLEEIYETWKRFRDGLTVYIHGRVNDQYRDEFRIFLDGLPEDSDYQIANYPMLTNGFGRGWEPLEDYTYDGADAAQYFRMRELAEEWGWENPGGYPAKHSNLCGELAVIGAIGGTIPRGLEIFNEEVPGGAQVLQSNNGTYGDVHLAPFFEQYGNWTAAREAGDSNEEDLAHDLRHWNAIVPLMQLNWTNGRLEGRQGGLLDGSLGRFASDAPSG